MGRSTPILLDGQEWSCKGYLGEEWRMRRAYAPDTGDVHGWLPARVPGSVLDDVVRAGEAPDPLVDMNSRACEWVPERSWVYRREVELAAVEGRVELQLDGIDHAADIFVNGTEVGSHIGAFTPATFDVTDLVRSGTNLIVIVLAPAPRSQPHIGRTSLVKNSKSRMTYGWDFCPRMIHLGIWDRTRLTFEGPATITDLFARPWLSADADEGGVACAVEVRADEAASGVLTLELERDGDVLTTSRSTVELCASEQVLAGEVRIASPERWWPNGYGDQPLYRLRASIEIRGIQDVREVTTAFRHVALVANEAAPPDARPYTLMVNGERIYVQGWNWVPMDVHHGVEQDDRLDHLLGLAARADVNLLRVWGGGPIERSSFYERCDRLGIMVWQEFPLSSSIFGSEPSHDPAYVQAMAAEARGIVRGRRNHPSLVLWCGGNELDDADGNPADGSHEVLVALEEVVTELDPDRAWLPTTPTGPTATCTMAAIDADPDGQHDVHGPWEHQGLADQRALYDRATSLLHSEFGVEGMANLVTIEAWLSPQHRWPTDRSNPHMVHRGDFWNNTPLLEEVFGPIEELTSLVAASQLLQADGLRYAIEANRRRQWRQSGSIPWQLNEPFPNVFSTSSVDHSGRPKAAYYAVAEAYAPLLVHARVPTQAWGGIDRFEATVWLSSRNEHLAGAQVVASLRDSSGECRRTERSDVEELGSGSTPVSELSWVLDPEGPALFWLDLQATDRADRLRATNRYLCARGEDLRAMWDLPTPELEVTWEEPGRRLAVRNVGRSVAVGVTARDARPARAPGYLWFGAGHLTLFPGERHHIDLGWTGVASGQAPPVVVDAWNHEGVEVA